MKITMLDMSGGLNFEKDDIVEGDLVVVFSADSKDDAGLEGRKLAQLLFKEIEFETTDDGVLICEIE
ncbi:MAG: hypothetical protein SVR94_11415 [Pseudomonadota bacterium]|nr:hypothetical protein [Pseudomonadota bacterium]